MKEIIWAMTHPSEPRWDTEPREASDEEKVTGVVVVSVSIAIFTVLLFLLAR